MENKFIRIDTWQPDKKEAYVFTDVKLIQLNIKKCFPMSIKRGLNPDALDAMSKFYINRTVYHNSIQIITNYIDYFITMYDDDKELSTVYTRMKEIIDTTIETIDIGTFRKTLMSEFFRRSNIKMNVLRLVEDNYQLDVTKDGTNREFLGKNDFTNDDAKALLAVSMMLKIIIPPLIHWVSINEKYKKPDKNELITEVFMDVFYKMCTEDQLNSIMRKLYIFSNDKVGKHSNSNSKLWDQQSALRGVTESNFTDKLIDEYLLTSNLFKFNFEQNIIAFIKTVIEKQLGHTFVDETYKKNVIHVDNNKGPDGLSGIDKLEQTTVKFDEAQLDISRMSIERIIADLEAEVGGIDEDEITFYMNHLMSSSKFHCDLVFYGFAKYFRGFRELYNINIREYTKLVIILKIQLEDNGYVQLPYLITSMIEGKVKSRIVQNIKFINKLQSSSTYQNIMKNKYSALDGFKTDFIISIISTVLTNKFSYVEYEEQELLGELISFHEDTITDELLSYIDSI